MHKNLQELQELCQQIAGKSIGEIASNLQSPMPRDLQYTKGWLGQLIEKALGATGGSHAVHDFPELKIELKTIPIKSNNTPIESTYVCTVKTNESSIAWHDSWVYNKLKKVIWVPIESEQSLPDRVIREPIFWEMDLATEEILRTDWEELMEMLQLGYGQQLTAKFGEYLHIRPKAANSKVLVDYIDQNGNPTKIVPKGFYLRTKLTKSILLQDTVIL